MIQNLESADIKKLKGHIRQSFWYGAATLVFFIVLFVFTLQGKVFIEPSVVATLGIIISGLVVWLMAGTGIKDLRSGKKEVIEKPLEIHDDERKKKISKVSALVTAWGFSKKKKNKHFLIHIDNATFEVTEEQVIMAEKKGSITVHYSLYGKKVLRVEV